MAIRPQCIRVVRCPSNASAASCAPHTGGQSFVSSCRYAGAVLVLGAMMLGTSHAGAQVGLFDQSWRPGGRTVIETPGSHAVARFIRAADSRWMIGGQCTVAVGSRACALRLLANGDVDTTYGDPLQGNMVLSDLAGLEGEGSYIVESDASGQVLFARTVTAGPITIGRVNAAGTAATNPPLSFHYVDAAASPLSVASKLLPAPDGSIYVIGRAGIAPFNTDVAIARLTPDLQLDPTFNGSGVRTIGSDGPEPSQDAAFEAALQPDGGLVVEASSVPEVGAVSRWVVRLLSDGSLDPSFGSDGRVQLADSSSAIIGAVAVDAQGRILLAGSRQFTVGNWDGYVRRLNPDGSPDSSFGDAGGAALGFNLVPGGNDFLGAMVVQPDGQILVGGYAQRAASSGFFVSARITSNGVYDPSFGAGGVSFGTFGPVPIPGNSDDTVHEIVLDDQGRLMVAGASFDGTRYRFGVGRIVTGLVIDRVFADGFE